MGSFFIEYDAIYYVGNFVSAVTHADAPHGLDLESFMNMTFYRAADDASRVSRTFTEVGFHRSKLPLDLYNSLSAYYYNNRFSYSREDGNDMSLTTNFWQADSHLIQMPFRIKVVSCRSYFIDSFDSLFACLALLAGAAAATRRGLVWNYAGPHEHIWSAKVIHCLRALAG